MAHGSYSVSVYFNEKRRKEERRERREGRREGGRKGKRMFSILSKLKFHYINRHFLNINIFVLPIHCLESDIMHGFKRVFSFPSQKGDNLK